MKSHNQKKHEKAVKQDRKIELASCAFAISLFGVVIVMQSCKPSHDTLEIQKAKEMLRVIR